jgi:hypothetical protein
MQKLEKLKKSKFDPKLITEDLGFGNNKNTNYIV